MSEQIIDIPPNTEVVITIAINPCSKCDPVEVPTLPDPVVEPIPTPIIELDPVVEPIPIPVIEPDPVAEPIPIPVIEPDPLAEPIPIPATEPQNDPPVVNTPPEVEPTTPIAETPVPEISPGVVAEPISIVDIPSEVLPEVKPIEPNPMPEPIQTVPEVSPLPAAPPVVIPDSVPIPIVYPPVVTPIPEASCDCKLTSTLSLAEFTKQLITAAKDLIYPSESESPIEVLSKGLNTRMPPIKGIEVRTLDRVLPSFLRQVDPDDQQTGNEERAAIAARWQALYDLITKHTVATGWHYPVKQKRYTHEELLVMLHPQGTIGLRIRLVET
jgi:hypothetical protein